MPILAALKVHRQKERRRCFFSNARRQNTEALPQGFWFRYLGFAKLQKASITTYPSYILTGKNRGDNSSFVSKGMSN